jgi:aryl-alcohol dehydrogenase-like predicted oxidoreductase
MQKITRRRFIQQTAAGASCLLAGCASTESKLGSTTADLVYLGKGGIRVPRVAMGTGTHGWKRASDQTRLGQEAFTRLVANGVERGAAFIDAADLYGSHPFIKHALRNVSIPRDRVTILSKIWFSEAPEMTPTETARPEVERFLQEMGVEWIDICLIHCVQDPNWPDQLERMREELSKLKQEGVVRAVGCSCHTHAALKTAAEHPWVDVILARINPEHKRMDQDATTDEVAKTLKRARSNGKGVIGMKIFGCGDLSTPKQRRASIEYVIQKDLVDAMTIGFTAPEQIDEVVDTVSGINHHDSKALTRG